MLRGAEGVGERARGLRQALSLPEVLLWRMLRQRPAGLKFRRQHPSGPYVADFYCHEARLIVEADGESHDRGSRPAQDAARNGWFAARGLSILRLPAAEVLRDPDAAADTIVRAALPLHHARHGPPSHAVHGDDLAAGAA